MKKYFFFLLGFYMLCNLAVNAQQLTLHFNTLPLKKGTFSLLLQSTPHRMIWSWDNQTDTSWAHDTALTNLTTFLSDYSYLYEANNEKPGEVYVTGQYLVDSTTQEIAFNKPKKSSAEHRLMELLFTLWYPYFDQAETVKYLEDLEQYFDFGLGIKMLNDQPLIYKLYGKITAYDAEQFRAFLEIIPTDTLVQIDMSNFQSMGRMFYSTLSDFNTTHPRLMWINCNPPAYRHLRNSGVPIERITFQKTGKR